MRGDQRSSAVDDEDWESNSDDNKAEGQSGQKETTFDDAAAGSAAPSTAAPVGRQTVGAGRRRRSSRRSQPNSREPSIPRERSSEGPRHRRPSSGAHEDQQKGNAAGGNKPEGMFRVHSSSSDVVPQSAPKVQTDFIVPSTSFSGRNSAMQKKTQGGRSEEAESEAGPPTPELAPTISRDDGSGGGEGSSDHLEIGGGRRRSREGDAGVAHERDLSSASTIIANDHYQRMERPCSLPPVAPSPPPPPPVAARASSPTPPSATNRPSRHHRDHSSGSIPLFRQISHPTPQPAQLDTRDPHLESPQVSSNQAMTLMPSVRPSTPSTGASAAEPSIPSPSPALSVADRIRHQQQPSPPPLRTASSHSSMNSIRRTPLPKRLVSFTTTVPTTAPPQLSSDGPIDWPASNSLTLTAVGVHMLGHDGSGDDRAFEHLRKSSFSSLRAPSGRYFGGQGGSARERTPSMASLQSFQQRDARASGHARSRTTAASSPSTATNGGGVSALASLRESAYHPFSGSSSATSTDAQRRKVPSSPSTFNLSSFRDSLAGGLTSAGLPSIAHAVAATPAGSAAASPTTPSVLSPLNPLASVSSGNSTLSPSAGPANGTYPTGGANSSRAYADRLYSLSSKAPTASLVSHFLASPADEDFEDGDEDGAGMGYGEFGVAAAMEGEPHRALLRALPREGPEGTPFGMSIRRVCVGRNAAIGA